MRTALNLLGVIMLIAVLGVGLVLCGLGEKPCSVRVVDVILVENSTAHDLSIDASIGSYGIRRIFIDAGDKGKVVLGTREDQYMTGCSCQRKDGEELQAMAQLVRSNPDAVKRCEDYGRVLLVEKHIACPGGVPEHPKYRDDSDEPQNMSLPILRIEK